MRRDLVLHFYAGAVIFGLVQLSLFLATNHMHYLYPLLSSFIAGLLKEIYDIITDKGTPEGIDLLFTAFGGLATLGATLLLFNNAG